MKNTYLSTVTIEQSRAVSEQISARFREEGRTEDNAPEYFIMTFGCQQNEADSEKIAGMAEAMGYRRSAAAEGASLIIVNTCAVREHAEKRELSYVGELKHIKEKDPDVIIGVCGCMTAQEKVVDRIKNSYPYVNFTFDSRNFRVLPSLVMKALEKGGRTFYISDVDDNSEGFPVSRKSKHSSWLSVMYGCNNFCTYCIVPHVRGRERSRQPEAVINEAREIIASGTKEIMLLGQNVNSYGNDLGNGANIASLMRSICSIDGDFVIRFMSSHPKDASDELIKVFAEEEKMVKHFHLPIQSGSDRILQKMNRRYTVGQYLKIIDKIRTAYPDATLTTDIMVGFPGETDGDFRDTMKLLEEVRYDMIFSFIYSKRSGTPAATMDGQIPAEVSSERFREMTAFQDAVSEERNRRFVGRTERLLVEEVSKTNEEYLTGRGHMARPVHFRGPEELTGQFVNVKIEGSGPYNLYGSIAES